VRDEVDACGRRRRSSPHRHGESVRVRFDLAVAEYGAITAPTLVVWTSDDPTADVTEGRRIASMIPGAQRQASAKRATYRTPKGCSNT
jgi:pimeloyl-ACP methyl ester carboxylesterase